MTKSPEDLASAMGGLAAESEVQGLGPSSVVAETATVLTASNDQEACPLCEGGDPDDLATQIRAATIGDLMTSEEFKRWLKSFD